MTKKPAPVASTSAVDETEPVLGGPPRESFPVAIGDAPDHLTRQIIAHHHKGDDAAPAPITES